MSTSKIYVGDVGTAIIVDCGSDLRGASADLAVRKPDGSETAWVASVVTVDGKERFLRYVTQGGDLDQPVTYKVQARVHVPGWSGRGATFEFKVYKHYK